MPWLEWQPWLEWKPWLKCEPLLTTSEWFVKRAPPSLHCSPPLPPTPRLSSGTPLCVYASILFCGFLFPKQYSSTRPAASVHHTIDSVLSDTIYPSFKGRYKNRSAMDRDPTLEMQIVKHISEIFCWWYGEATNSDANCRTQRFFRINKPKLHIFLFQNVRIDIQY